MQTSSLRRPLAAAALALAVVLASGAPARAAGTTSARAAQSRAPHAAPVPSAFQQWVNRLLAAIGLPPVTTAPNGTGAGIATTPQTLPNDNGAGIDPNG